MLFDVSYKPWHRKNGSFTRLPLCVLLLNGKEWILPYYTNTHIHKRARESLTRGEGFTYYPYVSVRTWCAVLLPALFHSLRDLEGVVCVCVCVKEKRRTSRGWPSISARCTIARSPAQCRQKPCATSETFGPCFCVFWSKKIVLIFSKFYVIWLICYQFYFSL